MEEFDKKLENDHFGGIIQPVLRHLGDEETENLLKTAWDSNTF